MRPCLSNAFASVMLPACSESQEAVEIRRYGLDSREGVITASGAVVDSTMALEGAASLRIDAESPTRVLLFETGDIDVEDARLVYRAQLRSEDLQGSATRETPFFLEPGQNPRNVKLNLIVEGAGTVWIDDVRLLSARLRP